MKAHTKLYLTVFKHDLSDPDQFVPSEVSNSKAVDIHHIVTRENRIENLMALTREEHEKYGEVKSEMTFLLRAHRLFLDFHSIEYDNEWFNKWIAHYEN